MQIGSIAGAASANAARALQQGASIRVADKVQDQQKLEGQAAVSLIESSGRVARGQEPGKGLRVDTYA